ncbi:MAG: ABC transporter ATP-binding protein [Lachnospiraceae bacterium]|jgi:putative ABC transport system ATP-binding protein|uniref:ABC transporter ATP-binding protein n=1 Tax=Candidatus Merdisoma sp. JLR.KK011 TaxID=3114299 RepID=UPI001434F5E1|nr:ABC transporter ATP-binding protein [Lachnospiraceae bacterium]MCI9623298.1 ABC transporter ATP-binding protein [Lachnospiraceae bacterium]GFI09672.1 ABC transporter ATP-binding protein YxdL [Lachnospiraceae bacterium]
MSVILSVSNIEKYYGSKGSVTKAIDNISFQVESGEFVGIMGASGSGKTTLLNCISTIDRVTSGEIRVGGKDITKLRGSALNKFRREELGFVFQDFHLLDTLTVYENIALALSIRRVAPGKIEKRVREAAARLGISGILNKYPYQISGGEKQRTASARAMIGDPKLILADEPTGALDSRASRMLLKCFEEMNGKLGATILMVTHDAFTASYASRILFIKDGGIFTEICRGEEDRKSFFGQIIDVVTLLGGDLNDAV